MHIRIITFDDLMRCPRHYRSGLRPRRKPKSRPLLRVI
jgi:hypothetical protein